MKLEEKQKLIAAYNQLDQVCAQLVLPVTQGANLVAAMRNLAGALDAIPVEPPLEVVK